MIRRLFSRHRAKRWLAGAILVVTAVAVSGCKTLGFYAQAIRGQYQIFAHQKSIEDLVQAASTKPELKARLELVQHLRAFARQELKLPVDGHYLKYADVHRPFVVWNVQAAPEFSMQPKTWWYPLVGRLQYRGYFFLKGATNYAVYLRQKGFDVAVGGVQAYSTLGWFKDPVLNTFIFEEDSELAEIIFHELGHQRVFARGDTDFNEAFATTVGQEGARRWLKAGNDTLALSNYVAHLRRNDDFVHLVMETRGKLEALYGDTRNEEGKVRATERNRDVPREKILAQKQQVYWDLKRGFETLRTKWGGSNEFDVWFAHPVNNAHLNSVAAYFDLVPGFEELLSLNQGNLDRFYDAVERLSRKPKKERHEFLRSLAGEKRKDEAPGEATKLTTRGAN